jgi:hypothetical protein
MPRGRAAVVNKNVLPPIAAFRKETRENVSASPPTRLIRCKRARVSRGFLHVTCVSKYGAHVAARSAKRNLIGRDRATYNRLIFSEAFVSRIENLRFFDQTMQNSRHVIPQGEREREKTTTQPFLTRIAI